MFVSVVICTWNRANLLDRTLNAMRRLVIPQEIEWELLVVNNNSTDDTDAIIERHARQLPIRRLVETRPGKSHAANLAVDSARGELVVCTDDDVLVDPDWLTEYVKAARGHPEATFFGGTVTPWFETRPPRWIVRHLSSIRFCFAICDLGPAVRPLGPREAPVGANMAFRTGVLRTYRFDSRLGPRKEDPRNGEETELIDRLRRAKHEGLWVGSARVQHFIPSARLKSQPVYTWHRWQGRVLARSINFGARPRLLLGIPLWVFRSYWTARLKAFLLSPFKGPSWLKAFLDSAKWKGCMEYYQIDRPVANDVTASTEEMRQSGLKV
jgi:glucosyl-dolichyl phosphate glucuronosyltransferase